MRNKNWMMLRKMVKAYNAGCTKCQNGYLKRIEIHHKDTFHTNDKMNNLIILCKSCHRQEHIKINKIKKFQKERMKIFQEIRERNVNYNQENKFYKKKKTIASNIKCYDNNQQ